MPEKTKEKKETQKEISGERADEESGAWSKDQREKGYYYDDNHGYEIYNPDEEDEDEED